MIGYHKTWLRIAAKAALPPDLTPHVLRHSFGSIAADLHYSELGIGALLGHRKATTTAKYTHFADAVLLQAADRVSARIAELMGEQSSSAQIVPMRQTAP
jgi:integrase